MLQNMFKKIQWVPCIIDSVGPTWGNTPSGLLVLWFPRWGPLVGPTSTSSTCGVTCSRISSNQEKTNLDHRANRSNGREIVGAVTRWWLGLDQDLYVEIIFIGFSNLVSPPVLTGEATQQARNPALEKAGMRVHCSLMAHTSSLVCTCFSLHLFLYSILSDDIQFTLFSFILTQKVCNVAQISIMYNKRSNGLFRSTPTPENWLDSISSKKFCSQARLPPQAPTLEKR